MPIKEIVSVKKFRWRKNWEGGVERIKQFWSRWGLVDHCLSSGSARWSEEALVAWVRWSDSWKMITPFQGTVWLSVDSCVSVWSALRGLAVSLTQGDSRFRCVSIARHLNFSYLCAFNLRRSCDRLDIISFQKDNLWMACLFIFEAWSLYSFGCFGTHNIDWISLELTEIHLLLFPKHWD